MENKSDFNIKDKKAKAFVISILIANFITNIGVSIIDIGLPNFIIYLSGNLIAFGLVVGIFSIAQSTSQFPMALFSDKYGRKRIVAIGMVIYITGTFLCAVSQTIFQLLFFRAVQGLGAYSSVLQAMISERYNKSEHGKAMAYYSFSLSAGYFGGIVIGGYISYYLGFRSIFLIAGTLATISAFFFFLLSKETKSECAKPNKEKAFEFKGVKLLFKENQFTISVLLNCIRWFCLNGVLVYLIWIFEIYWELNEIETSYFLLIVVSIYIFFVLFGGKLIDQYSAKKVLILGQLIIIVFGVPIFVVSLTHNFFLFIVSSVFSGIGFALALTAGNSILLKVIEETQPDLKGSGFGINNALGFFCGAIGPILFSILGTITIFLPYYVIIVMTLISFVISIVFLEK